MWRKCVQVLDAWCTANLCQTLIYIESFNFKKIQRKILL